MTCTPSVGVHPQHPAAPAVEVAVDLAHVGSGMRISTAMIGSSRAGFAWWTPSLSAIEAAILNESSFESTGWNEPS